MFKLVPPSVKPLILSQSLDLLRHFIYSFQTLREMDCYLHIKMRKMRFREVTSFAQEHPAGTQVYVCLTTWLMFPVQHWLPGEKGRRKDFCYLNIFPPIFAEHCSIFAHVTHMLLQQPLYPHFPFEEAESQRAICPVFPTKEMAELRFRKSDPGSLTPKPAL